jgi:hypothetical protein
VCRRSRTYPSSHGPGTRSGLELTILHRRF